VSIRCSLFGHSWGRRDTPFRYLPDGRVMLLGRERQCARCKLFERKVSPHGDTMLTIWGGKLLDPSALVSYEPCAERGQYSRDGC
jgi:hypothetical protein